MNHGHRTPPRDPRPVAALIGLLALAGCNSEPTGDAAYGQEFEKPAGASAAAPAPEVDPYKDRKEKESEPAKKGRPRR